MTCHFGDWVRSVLDCVRFRPDRRTIRRELEAHYEDHVKDLERIGYDHKLAQERALGAMGDPVEVGRALDKVHKPWLGWLWLASKWGVLICWVFLLLSDSFWRLDSLRPVRRTGDYEPDGLFFFSAGAPERDDSIRIARGAGAQTVERVGYTISVPYAAVWKCAKKSGGTVYDEYWSTIVVAVDDHRFWDHGPKGIWRELEAADEHACVYRTQWDPVGGNFIWARSDADPFRALAYFQICQLEPPGEWLEISYPYGEPWSIRIDWREAS